MHPDSRIVVTARNSYSIYTRPYKPNTLTHQSVGTKNNPWEPASLALLHGILPGHSTDLCYTTFMSTSMATALRRRHNRREHSSDASRAIMYLPLDLSSALGFLRWPLFTPWFNSPFLVEFDSQFPIGFNSPFPTWFYLRFPIWFNLRFPIRFDSVFLWYNLTHS